MDWRIRPGAIPMRGTYPPRAGKTEGSPKLTAIKITDERQIEFPCEQSGDEPQDRGAGRDDEKTTEGRFEADSKFGRR
jgi:hypothetical protein